ncbi:MAG TPA: hypothetical protein VNT60_05395 [Deinococcales bacterium]|nr:hypothetical protein [Deinococcales bacterium]
MVGIGWAVIFGIVAGLILASAFFKAKTQNAYIIFAVAGAVGAVIVHLIFNVAGLGPTHVIGEIIAAVVGAFAGGFAARAAKVTG